MSKSVFTAYNHVKGSEQLVWEPKMSEHYSVSLLDYENPIIHSYKDKGTGKTFVSIVVLVRLSNTSHTKDLALKIWFLSSEQYRDMNHLIRNKQPLEVSHQGVHRTGVSPLSSDGLGRENKSLQFEDPRKYHELQMLSKKIKFYLDSLKDDSGISISELKNVISQVKFHLYLMSLTPSVHILETESVDTSLQPMDLHTNILNELLDQKFKADEDMNKSLGLYSMADWVPNNLRDQSFKDKLLGCPLFDLSCVYIVR